MVGSATNDPFAQQQLQTHTRVARFRFVQWSVLRGWVPVPNISVSYADTYDDAWREQRTSLNGKIAITCTYSLDRWKSGVVLSLDWNGIRYVFDMTEINHGNTDFIDIQIKP
jgi:hypothetical protein